MKLEALSTVIGWIATAFIGPVALAIVVGARRVLRRHAIHASDAVLWVFSSNARRMVSATINMRRYCRAQLGDSGNAKLLIPSSHDVSVVEIDDLFIDMRLDGNGAKTRSFTNETILSAGSRIRVIGDPGSGKSSLAMKVLRDACRASIATPLEGLLPIHVRLRDLDKVPEKYTTEDQRAAWLLAQLERKVTDTPGHRMDDFFRSSSETTGLLILLDGLDEVPTPRYSDTVAAINAMSTVLSRRSEHNQIILTMRVQFHSQARRDLEASFPNTLRIKPFTPADIYEFLIRWYPKDQDGLEKANRIYAELADRPTLREICGNPLILSMYVANYRDTETSTAPDTRTSFYHEVVRELLVRRRRKQKSGTDRNARVDTREKLLGQMALENMLDLDQAANCLDWQRGVETTAAAAGVDPVEAERIMRELANHTGIFSEERSGETYRFIHLTFCEFFAGLAIAQHRRDGWDLLMRSQAEVMKQDDASARSRFAEMIPFALALLPDYRLDDAISDVLRLGDMEILGRCLLETQRYDHPAWEEYTRIEYANLAATTSDEWDGAWLKRLHLYQTAVSDAMIVGADQLSQPARPAVSLEGLFTQLVADDKRLLVELFSTFAARDAVAAFRLANACQVDMAGEAPNQVVTACDSPAFLAQAVEKAKEGDIAVWAQILTEAALRRTMVADHLMRFVVPDSLRAAAAAVPRQQQWGMDGLSGWSTGTYLEMCLTVVAAKRNFHQRLNTTCLQVLHDVAPPPMKFRRTLRRALGVHLPAIVVLGLMTVIVAFVMGPLRLPFASAAFASTMITVLLVDAVLVGVGLFSLKGAYRRLVGVAGARSEAPGTFRRLGLTVVGAGDVLDAGSRLIYLARTNT